jgi:DNA-binding CsgD family transcriptional regulator
VCAAGLAQARDVGDMADLFERCMAVLDLRAGRTDAAAAQLHKALQAQLRAENQIDLALTLEACGQLCTQTGRRAEALTVLAALAESGGYADFPEDDRRLQDLLRENEQALGHAEARAAQERGAAMSLPTVAEYALMLTAPDFRRPPAIAPGGAKLSARERELVTLVAQGRTDAQIAEQLYISVRTVRSHLDRIRDKTGCRRRADLTRLALQTHLILGRSFSGQLQDPCGVVVQQRGCGDAEVVEFGQAALRGDEREVAAPHELPG